MDVALDLIGLVADAADARGAAQRLAQKLRQHLGADRVALMPMRGTAAELVVPEAPKAGDAAARDWHLLRDESARSGRLVRTSASALSTSAKPASPDMALRHHHTRHAIEHRLPGVMTVPLRHGGRAFAYLVLERRERAFSTADAEVLRATATLSGPWLALARRAERSLAQQAFEGLKRSLPRERRAVQWLTAASFACGAVALAMAVLWPVEARVTAPAHVEGVEQRQLVAPVDGYLQRVLVRPGDDVSSGQMLAELDDRELQLEERRLGSEVSQESSQADEALARNDRAGAVIHQAKADASSAQLELTRLRLQQAALRAPFDGVIVEGDLRNRTGAPIKQGDLLMSIAPAGRYRVLADVAERDIASVQPGAVARLVLAADPDHPLKLVVKRVSPVGHEVDGQVSFEIEASPESTSPAVARLLRPGLSGVMRIEVGSRPLWRTLGGRAIDAVRYQAWAWGLVS